ncbi:MAG TPA: hypothetical protein VHN12_06135 [Geobacteraceae bacterium]|nr:hypothetical protein [Geobacteraceae bacterium]
MQILHLAMIGTGIGAVVWGLPAAHRLKKPWDIAAVLLVLAGVVTALLGTLLTAVPGFFMG